MFRRRLLPALLISALVIAALLAACSPFGGNDDTNDDDNPAPDPPTATREISMATFTPTEVVPPEGQTATAAAGLEAQNATATARAGLPTPTPAASIEEEDVLYPPRTRLETPSQLIDSYLGTYSWQFDDPDQTYANVEAPITVLNQGDPIPIENTAQLAIRYYGEWYRSPPRQLAVEIYDYASNSATPLNPQTGQPADEPAFAINAEPLESLRVDPANPTFSLAGFPPGHYIIRAQGQWGQHPALERQLFVTWVFDIEIVE